ncbi:MAG: hypothetical protein ACTXNS_01090 [Candidatus Carsonella ruddii]
MLNQKIKKKIFKKKNKIILLKKKINFKIKILVKIKNNIKLINIFYKKKTFLNNKKNNIFF